jgi:hypothetical protein
MPETGSDETPTALVDRDGMLWRSFSGIWYRREASGGYGECRGTLTMLDRDFGPLTPPGQGAQGPICGTLDSPPEGTSR